jgi:hypothetical protein
LVYRNGISVTGGSSYTVVVGAAGTGATQGGGAARGGNGGVGAVRIIYSFTGTTRSFPSTNTGNL